MGTIWIFSSESESLSWFIKRFDKSSFLVLKTFRHGDLRDGVCIISKESYQLSLLVKCNVQNGTLNSYLLTLWRKTFQVFGDSFLLHIILFTFISLDMNEAEPDLPKFDLAKFSTWTPFKSGRMVVLDLLQMLGEECSHIQGRDFIERKYSRQWIFLSEWYKFLRNVSAHERMDLMNSADIKTYKLINGKLLVDKIVEYLGSDMLNELREFLDNISDIKK